MNIEQAEIELKTIGNKIEEKLHKDIANIVLSYLCHFECDECNMWYINKIPHSIFPFFGILCSQECFDNIQSQLDDDYPNKFS